MEGLESSVDDIEYCERTSSRRGGGGVKGCVTAGVSARRGGCNDVRHWESTLSLRLGDGRGCNAESGDSATASSVTVSSFSGSIMRWPIIGLALGVGGEAGSSVFASCWIRKDLGEAMSDGELGVIEEKE